MPSESGGAPVRRGMEFQDYAAAHHYLQNSKANKLHVERFEDFSLFYFDGDYQVKNIYEVKSQENGQYTVANFKNNIVDNFAELTREHNEDGVILQLHLVTNFKLQRRLLDFFEDVDALRAGAMQWHSFERQHKRDLIDPIRDRTDLNDDDFRAFLGGLSHHFHSLDELEAKIEGFLRDCNPGKYRKGALKMLNLIHETDSSTITRDEFEDTIGFDPTKREGSTSSTSQSRSELVERVQDIQSKHEDATVDVDSPLVEKEQVKEYASEIEGDETINSTVVESRATNVTERLDELEEVRRKERSIRNDVATDLGGLLDMDDSTSSTGGDGDD